jgi:hypothetical protein
MGVLSNTLVVSAADDLAHERILHHDASQFTHISCSRFVVFMTQPMRVSVVGALKAKSTCITVHLLKEILHGLVCLKSSLVVVSHWLLGHCLLDLSGAGSCGRLLIRLESRGNLE